MQDILEDSFPQIFLHTQKINMEREHPVEYLPADRFPEKIKKIGKRSEPMSAKLGANEQNG